MQAANKIIRNAANHLKSMLFRKGQGIAIGFFINTTAMLGADELATPYSQILPMSNRLPKTYLDSFCKNPDGAIYLC